MYQQFSSGSQTNSWVILQAPAPLQDRLRRAFGNSNDTAPGQQFQLHPVILLCVSDEWRDYLSYLEEDFSLLVSLSMTPRLRRDTKCIRSIEGSIPISKARSSKEM
jgi:hypothetical protein